MRVLFTITFIYEVKKAVYEHDYVPGYELVGKDKDGRAFWAAKRAKTCASTEIRTQDLMLTKHALCQLSHGG